MLPLPAALLAFLALGLDLFPVCLYCLPAFRTELDSSPGAHVPCFGLLALLMTVLTARDIGMLLLLAKFIFSNVFASETDWTFVLFNRIHSFLRLPVRLRLPPFVELVHV